MTPLSTMLRFTGTALVASLLSVAACATDNAPLDFDDAGTPPPDTGAPVVDGGADSDATDLPPPKPTCGNFKVEDGETCDDGNTNDNDGCSSTCQLESAFEGDICPGKTLALQTVGASLKGSATGTTAMAYGQYGSACGGGSGKDVVYTFTPPSSGKAIVTLSADFQAIVSARSMCDAATSESTCSDIVDPAAGSTTIEIPIFQNTPVFLFVDGYGGTSGNYTLDVDVSLAVCGNGVAELPETCDDGNTTNGDGCSSECTLEALGVADACPGMPFQLSGPAGAPRKVSFAGDTSAHTATSQGAAAWCFFTNAQNAVYAVKSDITGAVKAHLVSGYPRAALHVRSDCNSNTYQLGCGSTHTPGPVDVAFPVKAGQWFYLFVDQYDNGGPYTLDVEVTPAECGNHVLDGNEACDDGNAQPGDGCSPQCELEPLTGVDTCPGRPLVLTEQPDGSRTALVSGTTAGLTNAVRGCQVLINTTTASDAIFAVTPDVDGLLTMDLTGPFNSVVSLLSRCEAPAPTQAAGLREDVLACSFVGWSPPLGSNEPWIAKGHGSVPKSAHGPVLAGHTYYVVVDGLTSSGQAASGPFELNLRLTPPVCGNGIIEGAETCDDGGTEDNDGCSATCTLEPVGPRNTCGTADDVAFLETGPSTWEASIKSGTTNLTRVHNFDASETTAGACWARGPEAFFKVTAPAAGVLRANARSSAFDVILALQRKTCSNKSALASCSNAGPKGTDEIVATPVAAGDVVYLVVDSPYLGVVGCEKDDAVTGEISPTYNPDCEKTVLERGRFTLDVSITPSGCGDGFFVPSATEECDDGNTISGDGCSSTCKLEPLAGIDTCPGYPLALSGAGAQQRRGQVTLSTAALSASHTGICGGNGREGVVRVVPDVTGVLRARLRNMLTGTLYARSVCADPSTEFRKTTLSTCPSVVHDYVTFNVVAGNEYFLFADGLDGTAGVPTVEVTIDP